MNKLIIKYALFVIGTVLTARLVTFLIMLQFPLILTETNPDGSTTTLSLGLIERGLEYAMNIILIILMKKDLKNQNLKSPLILIITFFLNFIGVIFFLLFSLQNKLTQKT
jgi:hypothetical protein